MSVTAQQPLLPIALSKDQGEAIWSFGALATIKATTETTGGRMALIEILAPRGAGSPLHVHHKENEWFYVLEGELTFWVGGKLIKAGAGSFTYGPRDIPHTFDVTSSLARFVLGAEPAGFEKFMRTLSEPATSLVPPPATVQVPSMERILAAATQFGIEILGPPGIPS